MSYEPYPLVMNRFFALVCRAAKSTFHFTKRGFLSSLDFNAERRRVRRRMSGEEFSNGRSELHNFHRNVVCTIERERS